MKVRKRRPAVYSAYSPAFPHEKRQKRDNGKRKRRSVPTLTYQDWLEAAASGEGKIDFIRRVISEHCASGAYLEAVTNKAYYDGENPTIMRYEKVLFDLEGRAHKDLWTANHKIASSFFGFAVDQAVFYLLGNGVSFKKDDSKKKLGKDFDQQLMKAALYAQIAGVSYALWNYDRLIPFRLTEFAPLKDEETGAVRAGIRFWRLAENKPLRVTFYEADGFSEYGENRAERILRETRPKTPYNLLRRVSGMGAAVIGGANYPDFPIVPLRCGDDEKSALNGKRNTIDALDLARSKMVNNTDEGNLIYWVLKNYGGMDNVNLAQFVNSVKALHAVKVNTEDAHDDIEAHTLEAPFEGTQATIDGLLKQLYEDFQCFNAAAVTASNQSATAVRASYVPLDLKTDKFEAQVTLFIQKILALAGIDDEPTYTRNQIINIQEAVQSITMAAQYFDEAYTTKKLLTILGDADQYDEMMKRKDAEGLERLSTAPDEEEKPVRISGFQ